GHARINSINAEAARRHPGVVAVYLAEDLKGAVGPIAVAVPLGKMTEGMGIHGPLAEGKVRFYGDPVAVVIAEDRYGARDARDLIDVDYEPLPVAIDVEKACSLMLLCSMNSSARMSPSACIHRRKKSTKSSSRPKLMVVWLLRDAL